MFKTIDFHFDNNTSRDQLFVSIDNRMNEKPKTNILDKIRLTDNILMNKENDNSNSLLDNYQFNDFMNNKKKIEDKTVLFIKKKKTIIFYVIKYKRSFIFFKLFSK